MPDEQSTKSGPDAGTDPRATMTRYGTNDLSTAEVGSIDRIDRIDRGEVPFIPGYEIQGRLGVGGMGVVFRAVQQPLNRPVALKMIRGAIAPGSRSLVRFLAEAEAAAAVSHENVVRVFEYGEVGGSPFLALEYLSGGSLAARLERGGAVDLETTVAWLAAVARGVAAAHKLGIVHRDLKPGNILFDARGVPKVTDFGLAKLRSGMDLTATQELMGTPAYMSPEQARGESKFVGPESDVWALGVMLYEVLAGRRPFESDSSWGFLQEILSKEPEPLRSVSKRIPRDLDVVCMKCLAKEPHRRYATAEQLADDLDRVRQGVPVTARPASVGRRVYVWFRRRPAVTVSLAAVVLVLVCIVAFGWNARRQVREVRQAALVERLRTASPDEVPLVAAEMEPFGDEILPRVSAVLNDANESSDGRLNAAIVLAKHGAPQAIELLRARLAVAPIRELRSVVAALSGHAQEFPNEYWAVVSDARQSSAAKLRFAAVLAAVDPGAAAWKGAADELAGALVANLSGDVGEWARLFKRIRSHLHDPLMNRMTLDAESDAGTSAAEVLATLYDDEPAALVTGIDRASLSQVSRFARPLSALDDRLFPEARLTSSARRELGWNPAVVPTYARMEDEVDPQLAADADARARVRPALALLAKGRGESVWPLLEPGSNPRIRSYLIEHAASSGIDPMTLVRGIDAATSAGVRAALILALGNYAPVRFSQPQFEAVSRRLVELYESDPAAGVHSACRWTLYQFQQSSSVRAIDLRTTSTHPVPGRHWMTTPDGTTFAIMPAGEAVVGSPPSEWNRDNKYPKSEDATRVLIPRTTALATTEVTFEQYQRFLHALAGPQPEKLTQPTLPALAGGVSFDDWSAYSSRLTLVHTIQRSRFFRLPGCPMGSLPLWLAMAYCRWLGDQQGIPDEEQPYAPVGTILIHAGLGPSVRPDYLNRTGYRMPTEYEWEVGTRAGARTRYPFGSDELLVPKYAVCQENTDDCSLPVARFKPNALGLFDVTGNVREWCHGEIIDRLPLNPIAARLDDGLQPQGSAFVPVMPRSSSFSDPRCNLRTAHRGIRFGLNEFFGDTGFRLARTIRGPGAPPALPAMVNELVRVQLKGQGTFRVAETTGVIARSHAEGSLPRDVVFHVPTLGDWVRPAFSATILNPETGEQLHIVRERGDVVRVLPQRVNDQGVVFSLIPAGKCLLGRMPGLRDDLFGPLPPRPVAWGESAPANAVIEKPFGLGTHEITFAQYEKFAAEKGYRTVEEVDPPQKRLGYTGKDGGVWVDEPGTQNWITYGKLIPPRSPVAYMAPKDAAAFCEWLESKRAWKHRLPTEAEWEHACRGGTSTVWPFGDSVIGLSEYAWHRGNCIFVQEIGRKRPNRYGLYDMLGNVGEWCASGREFALRGQDISAHHYEVRPEVRLPVAGGRATNLSGFRVACDGWTPTFAAAILPHSLEFAPHGAPAQLLSIDRPEQHPKGALVPVDSYSRGREWWYLPEQPGAFGWNAASTWDLSYLDWKPANEKALVPSAAEWADAKARVLRKETRPCVNYNWADECPMTLHGRSLGVVFETELELPAGDYELALASGSGHRVFVDDRVVMDVWELTRYVANRAETAVPAGRHRIRIETHKREQTPDLRFNLRLLRFAPK